MTRPPPATRRKDGKAPPQRDLFQLDSPLIGEIGGGRQGTKLIGGHFAPEVSTQLRILAAEEGQRCRACWVRLWTTFRELG